MANRNKKNEEVPVQEERAIEAAETDVDTIDGVQSVTEETKDEAKDMVRAEEPFQPAEDVTEDMVRAEEPVPVDESPDKEVFECALGVARAESPDKENSYYEPEKKSDDDAKAQQEKVNAYARMFGYGYTGQNY